MAQTELLIHGRWVVPMETGTTVLEHHSIAVDQGRITAVVPRAQADTEFSACHTVDCAEHVLLPGLINCHTHAAMTLFRGLADDLPLMTWLNDHIWPAEGRWVNDQFVRSGTELAIAEMILGGTTCFNDMYFFPDETARACREHGMRCVIGMILIDFPTVWAKDANEYLDKGIAVHEHYRDHPLVTTALAPHAPYSVSDEPLTRARALAEKLDVPIHMHVHETRDEITRAAAQGQPRPLARLASLGLLTGRLMAVHMTQLNDDEIETIAASGTHVVHCPESNLKLASGFCPVQRLLAAGINVALGTDGAASNNDLDMLGELRSAALLAKGVAQDACAVPASQALAMATINGARALGLDQDIGSLRAGKAADLIAVDLSDITSQPVYDVISHLVYCTHRHQVTDVWIQGRAVLSQRRLVTLNVDELAGTARTWRDQIRSFDRHEPFPDS